MIRCTSDWVRLFLCGLAAAVAVGCTSGRELVGKWTAVDASKAPSHMARINVTSITDITLDNGDAATYSVDTKEHTVRITFPDGQAYTYGFTRSGENMTLLDGTRKIRYLLDQG